MDSSVEQIKDRLSIHEVVGGYVQLQRAGRNYRAKCPFHKERTPSFMVSPERGSYMCFGCGEKGDIFSFVQKIEGIDFPTALKQLAERAGVVLERFSAPSPQNKEKEERLRDVCEAAAVFFEETLAKRPDVQKYVRDRGVSDETRKLWRIGYAPARWRTLSEHLMAAGYSKDDIAEAGLAARSEKQSGEIYDRFRGRIMFPIADAGGKIVAFSGRFFEKVEGQKDDSEPAKYVNSPETPLFKKSKILYGLDHAKNAIRKADCILLVEGQFDLVLSHQSGLPFTVALSGTALTQEHLSLLGRLSKRLILALDADEAGIRAGLKSALLALQSGFDVKVPVLSGGKDPADIAKQNPEDLKAAIRASKTAIEFFLDTLYPTARDERAYKKAVEMQIVPLVAALPSKIEQEHFIRIVAERLRVPEDAVRTEVLKRPTLPEEALEPEVRSADIPAASSLEKAAALLLFRFPDDAAVTERISSYIGKERLAEIRERMKEHVDRFQFEFDLLGENTEDVSADLFAALERSALDEEMERIRTSLRSSPAAEAAVLAQKLSGLKRRQQELQK